MLIYKYTGILQYWYISILYQYECDYWLFGSVDVKINVRIAIFVSALIYELMFVLMRVLT